MRVERCLYAHHAGVDNMDAIAVSQPHLRMHLKSIEGRIIKYNSILGMSSKKSCQFISLFYYINQRWTARNLHIMSCEIKICCLGKDYFKMARLISDLDHTSDGVVRLAEVEEVIVLQVPLSVRGAVKNGHSPVGQGGEHTALHVTEIKRDERPGRITHCKAVSRQANVSHFSFLPNLSKATQCFNGWRRKSLRNWFTRKLKSIKFINLSKD